MKHVHITGRLAHGCFSMSFCLSGVVKTWWRSLSPPTSALWLDVLLKLSPLIGRPLSVSEENTVQSFRMAPKIFHCGLRNWFCLWTLFVWGVSIKTTPKENKNSMMNSVIISHKKVCYFSTCLQSAGTVWSPSIGRHHGNHDICYAVRSVPFSLSRTGGPFRWPQFILHGSMIIKISAATLELLRRIGSRGFGSSPQGLWISECGLIALTMRHVRSPAYSPKVCEYCCTHLFSSHPLNQITATIHTLIRNSIYTQ